ncbi:ferredoxin reductase family protein [Arcticibacter eurypsychrophilus]|uniref:ferredoxin reductase family protein n=1 Tax=Arcticibacter eurypsychrophilus TaxID=1434752 RepID=UPI00084D2A36|nr:ferric reductase-like transmembrane domain-containing protein [Arcticibacter eurypsychrophilus]
MKNLKPGNYVIWVLALLVIPLSLLSVGGGKGHHDMSPAMIYLNMVIALLAYSTFTLSFVLCARIKWLEHYFGGLDKMYQMHHKMALVAFILLLSHPFLLAIRWIPNNFVRFLLSIFPLHRRLEVNLGSYALWGIILLMLFTLVIKLPYRTWKISHKFMGLFLIVALLHTFILISFSDNPLLWIYLCFISGLGVGAFLYQTVFFGIFNSGYSYKVDAIERVNERIMTIEFSPVGKKLHFSSGQFCFFNFCYPGISKESHPYTLFPTGNGNSVQIMVKALGDYTNVLHRTLKLGAKVLLRGPYGSFDFREGKKDQVWIAGGVGIAPFISWIKDLQQRPFPDLNAELYYCVHQGDDAIYTNEMKSFEEDFKGFHLNLICTAVDGKLKIKDIPDLENKDIFLCGPQTMTRSFIKNFKEMGISPHLVHYENFDFR